MSRQRFLNWQGARSALRADRAARPELMFAWTSEPTERLIIHHVARNAAGRYAGAVFSSRGELNAVIELADYTTRVVPGSWPMTPIGLRDAQTAVEAAHAAQIKDAA
jgi:hypothetical protein